MNSAKVTYVGVTDGKKLVRLGDTLVTPKARVEITRQDGAPDIAAEFEIQDGVPECTSILWKQKPGGRAIRTADIRLIISIDNLAEKAFLRNAHVRRADAQGWLYDNDDADPHKRKIWASIGDVHETFSQRGRGPSQANLEEVARVYKEHIGDSPTAAVESWFGYSRRTAARRVQQARDAGLLPRTTPGRKKA